MSGKITGRRLEISDTLYPVLNARLEDKGWDSVRQFALNNARTLSLSPDSVNRAFNPSPFKGLEVHNLTNVMYHLEYTRSEIVCLLKEHTNDDVMVKLLGESCGEEPLTPEEQALLSSIRTLSDAVPGVMTMLGSLLEPIAKAHNVDINSQIGTLTRTGHDKRAVNKRRGGK